MLSEPSTDNNNVTGEGKQQNFDTFDIEGFTFEGFDYPPPPLKDIQQSKKSKNVHYSGGRISNPKITKRFIQKRKIKTKKKKKKNPIKRKTKMKKMSKTRKNKRR